jgi:hypothetical protein
LPLSYLVNAREQYTKEASAPSEPVAIPLPRKAALGGRRWNQTELGRNAARGKVCKTKPHLGFPFPSREFNPCPAYDVLERGWSDARYADWLSNFWISQFVGAKAGRRTGRR